MKKLIAGLLFLLFTTTATAADLRFVWTYGGDVITGFTIYERTVDGKVVVIPDIPPGSREATATVDVDIGECKTYFMTAKNSTIESLPSEALGWCNDTELPDLILRPGSVFNLNITVPQQ